jgi:membrane-bound lytic murein transglycosylase D
MPDTAREYGLRVDWWVDERADPEKSTRAAASYLRDLYREFDDWSLALAAYNCGPGRVARALERTEATTFWELLEASALPRETRGYVPTFYATLLIASDPETYGFRLAAPDASNDAVVVVEGPVSLHYVAEVAGLDEETVRELNPALRRNLVPPGRHPVRVPATVAPLVAERATTMKDEDVNLAVCSFKLRRGDTVAKLARKLGTKPDTILAMNGLREGARLSSGRSLYLPVRARELGALLRQSEDVYTVVKGDTLYSIAKRHGLSTADLRELNDLPKKATLKVGQKLRVAPGRGVTAGGG